MLASAAACAGLVMSNGRRVFVIAAATSAGATAYPTRSPASP